MSDSHTESLHEELLASFMAAAQMPREIAATNEIERLRKEIASLKAELAATKKASAKK